MLKMIKKKKDQQGKKEKSFGRSMVEMLGVLAVIGVLSIGGIVAYRYAMVRYRANEIAHLASLLYQTAISANGGEGISEAMSATELLPDIRIPEEVGIIAISKDGFIGIQLKSNNEALGKAIDQIEGGRVDGKFTCTKYAIEPDYCILNMKRLPADPRVTDPTKLTPAHYFL